MPPAGSFTLPEAEQVIIEFDVEIEDPLFAVATEVCNQGVVSFTEAGDVDTDDPDTGTADDATCTTLVVDGDLTISKTSPASVLINAGFVYTITVTNSGPSTFPLVTVTDTVPMGFAITMTNGCDNVTVVSQLVTCEFDDLAPGGGVPDNLPLASRLPERPLAPSSTPPRSRPRTTIQETTATPRRSTWSRPSR